MRGKERSSEYSIYSAKITTKKLVKLGQKYTPASINSDDNSIEFLYQYLSLLNDKEKSSPEQLERVSRLEISTLLAA